MSHLQGDTNTLGMSLMDLRMVCILDYGNLWSLAVSRSSQRMLQEVSTHDTELWAGLLRTHYIALTL